MKITEGKIWTTGKSVRKLVKWGTSSRTKPSLTVWKLELWDLIGLLWRQLEFTLTKLLALKNGSGEFGEVDRLEAWDLERIGGGDRGYEGDDIEKAPAQQIFNSIEDFQNTCVPRRPEELWRKNELPTSVIDVAEWFREWNNLNWSLLWKTWGGVIHGRQVAWESKGLKGQNNGVLTAYSKSMRHLVGGKVRIQ